MISPRLGAALAALLCSVSLAAQQPPAAQPLTLEAALQMARTASEAVGLARAAVTRAQGEQYRARSEFFPQLGASASYTRLLKSQYSGFASSDSAEDNGTPRPSSCERFAPNPALPIGQRVDSLEAALECVSSVDPFGSLGSLPFGRVNTYNLGLSLSQTLFAGGRVRGQLSAANAGRRSAEIGLSAAEAELTLDVVQTYFDAVLAEQLARIATSALGQADTTLAQTELRRAVGTVPEFDLLRARVTRDNARAAAIQRASDRDIARLRLKQLLDLPDGRAIELTTALDDSALAATPTLAPLLAMEGDTSAGHRAPVRQAAEGVTAQEGLLKVAASQHYPAVSLSSAYGRVAYPGSG
ncbi:MAG: TolC family protein, partial [Gemmatimonadales bacterium]|nr:TolC family protein [Gemmatimonadales bacterium]